MDSPLRFIRWALSISLSKIASANVASPMLPCHSVVGSWLGWQDSNLWMPESTPIALPLGDITAETHENFFTEGVFKQEAQLGRQDTNLRMTGSKPVALPLGDILLEIRESFVKECALKREALAGVAGLEPVDAGINTHCRSATSQ